MGIAPAPVTGVRRVTTNLTTKSMKLTSILTVVLTTLALAGGALAADKQYKAGSCCDKAAKKGEKCTHPCCVTAEKDGKVCAKCNK